MKKTNRRLIFALMAVLCVLALGACKKFQGDVTVPAYIHLDRIDVVAQRQNAPSTEAGFYSSDIDAVQFICYFEGEAAETTLGVFQLPCTVPVLHYGNMKYLRVLPVVKQNGSTNTRISYSYYKEIKIENIHVAADSVTNIGALDTATQLYTLHANYLDKGKFSIVAEDYFEPTSFSSSLDSNVVWVTNDPENACTGQGYGLVEIPDSVSVKSFYYKDQFTLSNSILYLEMDYQTDCDLYINMIASTSSGTTGNSYGVMCLKPNTRWQKIYINLGRTWSQFNYTSPILVYFQAANTEGINARVRLDNVKILSL